MSRGGNGGGLISELGSGEVGRSLGGLPATVDIEFSLGGGISLGGLPATVDIEFSLGGGISLGGMAGR
jgi:hypothetical protein